MQLVERQRNFLRNPLPPGDGVCAVCRSSTGEGFDLCYQCSRHRTASGGQVADVVLPVSYAIKGTQHAHNLIVYKATQPSAQAQRHLSSLGVMFIAYHWDCLARALGGPPSHIVTVPSTRGRQGSHPIDKVIADRMNRPVLRPTVNPVYPSDDREFHADRFLLAAGAAEDARVLLLDDTWTTGGRIQSLAHTLKTCGAAGVAAVVLGRHVSPTWEQSKPLVERLRAASAFDIRRCPLDD